MVELSNESVAERDGLLDSTQNVDELRPVIRTIKGTYSVIRSGCPQPIKTLVIML